MRTFCGYPSGPRSKLQPDTKAAFLTGSSAVSEQYFETVHRWVFTQECHNEIEAHLNSARTARDVIKLPPLSEAIETMKKSAAAAAAEKKDGADDESYELDSNDEEAKQDPSTPAKDRLRHAKDASPDRGVFIGFHHDGTEIR